MFKSLSLLFKKQNSTAQESGTKMLVVTPAEDDYMEIRWNELSFAEQQQYQLSSALDGELEVDFTDYDMARILGPNVVVKPALDLTRVGRCSTAKISRQTNNFSSQVVLPSYHDLSDTEFDEFYMDKYHRRTKKWKTIKKGK